MKKGSGARGTPSTTMSRNCRAKLFESKVTPPFDKMASYNLLYHKNATISKLFLIYDINLRGIPLFEEKHCGYTIKMANICNFFADNVLYNKIDIEIFSKWPIAGSRTDVTGVSLKTNVGERGKNV